jgi:precorrin-4/cobalt-precorrin-4 C11-methyltransferase
MTAEHHPVLFVGAGPGDPDLITVKGREALAQADLVVYAGSLVPKAVLTWCAPKARTISSAGLALPEIIDVLEGEWRKAARVVRLHTGDPSLYGAIFEQMAALDERAIPFRVIPGVTAAFAAAASLGIEFTLPEISQTLILTRMEGRTPVPEKESLDALAVHQATMAIYLSAGMIDQVAGILQQAYGERAPCAVVYQASQPGEKIIRTTLDNVAAQLAREKINRQAVIIVGRVLEIGLAQFRQRSKLYDAGFSHGYRTNSKSQ